MTVARCAKFFPSISLMAFGVNSIAMWIKVGEVILAI